MKSMVKWLTIVGVALLIAGCAPHYRAEKLYWKAEKAARELVLKAKGNPEGVSAEEREKVKSAFQKVVEAYPATKMAGKAQFVLGQLYLREGKLEEARTAFVKVSRDYSKLALLASEAQFMVGWIYEKQGDWSKAQREYEQIPYRYPLSRKGLQVPLYIARHYKLKGDIEKSKKLFKIAVRDYRKLINKAANKEMVAFIKGFIATGFMGMEDWDNAINTLISLADEYPHLPQAPISLFTLGKIYEERLNQPQKAVEVYQRLVQNYPRHLLAKVILNQNKAFKEKK